MSQPSFPYQSPPMPAPPQVVHLPEPQAAPAAPQPPAPPQPPPYTAPAGTAAQAAQQAVAPPPPPSAPAPVTEQLRQDAELPEWPPGAPKFRPVHNVPYRKRAHAAKMLARLQASEVQLSRFAGREISGEAAEAYYGYLADASEFLEAVAVDEADYRAWMESVGHDENKFFSLLTAYMIRLSPGEASRSAS